MPLQAFGVSNLLCRALSSGICRTLRRLFAITATIPDLNYWGMRSITPHLLKFSTEIHPIQS
jgi:hypothetical protein